MFQLYNKQSKNDDGDGSGMFLACHFIHYQEKQHDGHHERDKTLHDQRNLARLRTM